MKQKEKWAEEYAQNEYKDDMENDRGIACEAWLAGFEFAKKELLKRNSLPEVHDIADLGEEEV